MFQYPSTPSIIRPWKIAFVVGIRMLAQAGTDTLPQRQYDPTGHLLRVLGLPPSATTQQTLARIVTRHYNTIT